jgi:hypothetical protein
MTGAELPQPDAEGSNEVVHLRTTISSTARLTRGCAGCFSRRLRPGGLLLVYENASPDGEDRESWLAVRLAGAGPDTAQLRGMAVHGGPRPSLCNFLTCISAEPSGPSAWVQVRCRQRTRPRERRRR